MIIYLFPADPEPLRLQDICRSTIRSLIRSIAENEEPELTQKRKFKQKSNDRKLFPGDNCVVIPVFEDPTGIESGFTIRSSRFENFRPVAFERLIRNLARNYQNLNDNSYENEENDTHHDSENDDSDASLNFESNENESAADSNTKEEPEKTVIDVTEKVDDLIDETPTCSKLLENLDDCVPCSSQTLVDIEKSGDVKDTKETYGNSITEIDHTVTSKIANRDLSTKTISSRSRKFAIKIKKGRLATKIKTTKKHGSPVKNDVNHNSLKQTFDEVEESASDSKPKKVMKREKLDSGISEESDDGKLSVSNESSFSESTSNEPMEIDSDYSDFTEGSSCEESNNSEAESNDVQHTTNDSVSLKYRQSMEKKIKSLPLPNAIKLYLNYNREFCISC